MTSSEAIAFFGSEELAGKAAGCCHGSFRFGEHIRPMLQMRLYVASKGQLALDKSLALLLSEVVKTMFWENEE
jgi:hypothetical protein